MLKFVSFCLIGALFGSLYAFPSPADGRPADEEERAYFSQKSFEFRTNRSFAFNAEIDGIVKTADEKGLAVQMIRNCSTPVRFEMRKCGRIMLMSTTDRYYDNVLLQKSWIPYLLNITDADCIDLGVSTHKSVTFQVFATETTTCIFFFRLVENKNNTELPVEHLSFEVNRTSATMVPFASNIDSKELAITNRINLKHTFHNYVVFYLGKCGLMSPEIMELKFTDVEFAKLMRFREMSCTNDNSLGFETYISSPLPLEGKFYYELHTDIVEFVMAVALICGFILVVIGFIRVFIWEMEKPSLFEEQWLAEKALASFHGIDPKYCEVVLVHKKEHSDQE